jgi:hypothetical protein
MKAELRDLLAQAVQGGSVDGIDRADPELVKATVRIRSDAQRLQLDSVFEPTNGSVSIENFSVSIYLWPGERRTVGAIASGVAKGERLSGGVTLHTIMPKGSVPAAYTVACFVKLGAGDIQLWIESKRFSVDFEDLAGQG